VRFLLVDRIIELTAERATGIKCVSLADDVFADHFAGWPIFPGSLVLEAMAQLAGAMLDEAGRDEHMLALLVGVDRARFRRQVAPGDQLALEADVDQRVGDGVRVRVAASIGDERVADAVLSFVFATDPPAAMLAGRAELRALMQRGQWYR
jgi:3-hydroxyacyl-[acyl-carrier-protein] dehydratase